MVLDLDLYIFTKKAHTIGGIKGAKFADLVFNNMDPSHVLMLLLQRYQKIT